MCAHNSLYYTSRSETNQNDYKNSEIIADYAYVLKEKVLLERSKSVLEVTCKDKEKRLNDAISELSLARKKIESNEEIIDTLQQQLKANLEHMKNEKQVFQVLNEQREATITDLQTDIRDIRKKYCGATADLARALKQAEAYQTKCKEYKDKLRGFAILFTYFNDPKRDTERSAKQPSATTSKSSQLSSITSKTLSGTNLQAHRPMQYEHDKRILSELFFKHAYDEC